ncbi:MAG: phosphatase PAP2 family protein [Porphyromonadaceae bacterium]|nr:phosphatase PAP2 family protein [Porphyromonadaceae bacterium]
MKCYVLLLFCFVCLSCLSAEEHIGNLFPDSGDTIRFHKNINWKIDKFSDSRLYRMTYIGVPLIVAGILVKGEDDRFRSLRNDYMPYFKRRADNYLQYASAAVMLGMKGMGVEGRSSWGRMLVSDAFSIILMTGTVNILKRTTCVERPDGSDNHSFPSGHTATAFMTATMLSKEYGHKSQWVSIGAYTVASATGLMRMANNRHWLSDVITGAGIGILSTELGYYLADLIFKGKGIKRYASQYTFDRMAKPSFISLYLGINIPLSKYDIDERNEFRTSSGSAAGVEGAYFINPYIGFGGSFVASNTSIIVNDDNAEDDTFDAITLCGGAYVSYPLSSRWLIGSKLLAGYARYSALELSERHVPASDGTCFRSGISLTFKANTLCGVRFFLDYNLMSPHSMDSAEWINMLTCGTSVVVSF